MVIIWSNSAKRELQKAYDYILKSSYQNANKVVHEIVFTIFDLQKHPEKHPLDKYKKDNDGT